MKGVYVLAIYVNKSLNVKVCAQKNFSLEEGFYAYIGSAQKNLEKRLMRHFTRTNKKCFWHIDRLLAADGVSVVKAFYKEAEKSEECRTAQSLGFAAFPVDVFGCSDCGCRSHLFHFSSLSLLENACLELGFKPIVLPCQ
ncbi:GIY-YIG nuclease family protein [Candidatus Bathyarchaeota archaeon]|nr:GIY-YIG nuclease family protein [Candidatus Bathyarchaeota archaeon]